MIDQEFDTYLRRWSLKVDGNQVITATSNLLPVTYHGIAAMLKLVKISEESRGRQLMR